MIATNPSANLKFTEQYAVTAYAKYCMHIKGSICNNNKVPPMYLHFLHMQCHMCWCRYLIVMPQVCWGMAVFIGVVLWLRDENNVRLSHIDHAWTYVDLLLFVDILATSDWCDFFSPTTPKLFPTVTHSFLVCFTWFLVRSKAILCAQMLRTLSMRFGC